MVRESSRGKAVADRQAADNTLAGSATLEFGATARPNILLGVDESMRDVETITGRRGSLHALIRNNAK